MLRRMIWACSIVSAVGFAGAIEAGAQGSQPAPKSDAPKDGAPPAPKGDEKQAATQNPVRPVTATPGATSRPSAADIIKAFERDRPVNTPVRPRRWQEGAPGGERGTGTRTQGLLREGEYIHNAVGRLIRDGSWWAFRFESNGSEAPRPPIRVLPNQQLERLQMEVRASAESPVFIVSGELTLFESSNYVLLRKVLKRRVSHNLQK